MHSKEGKEEDQNTECVDGAKGGEAPRVNTGKRWDALLTTEED